MFKRDHSVSQHIVSAKKKKTHSKNHSQPLGSELLSPQDTARATQGPQRTTTNRQVQKVSPRKRKDENKSTPQTQQLGGKQRGKTQWSNTSSKALTTNHTQQPTPMVSDLYPPQSPSPALLVDSEQNWSLIDQRGRTDTKNRPSQSRPPEDPTRKSHPHMGGASPDAVVETHVLCIQSQSRSR